MSEPISEREGAHLDTVRQALGGLPSTLSLVPVSGGLEIWLRRPRRDVRRGVRWVRVGVLPMPVGPGLQPVVAAADAAVEAAS